MQFVLRKTTSSASFDYNSMFKTWKSLILRQIGQETNCAYFPFFPAVVKIVPSFIVRLWVDCLTAQNSIWPSFKNRDFSLFSCHMIIKSTHCADIKYQHNFRNCGIYSIFGSHIAQGAEWCLDAIKKQRERQGYIYSRRGECEFEKKVFLI